jgi:hypothetical protein
MPLLLGFNMAKRIPEIKPLPEGKVPEYGISGVTHEQDAMVRGHISDAAVDAYPTGGIAFLPAEQYNKIAKQIMQQGKFGDQQIGRGQNAQESWGPQGSTRMGNGFSIRNANRVYLNADLLNNQKQLKDTLFHELGHLASKDASEDSADRVRDTEYMPRAKAQEQLTSTVGQLPMRPVAAAPLPEPLPPPPTMTPLGHIGSPEEDSYKLKALPR